MKLLAISGSLQARSANTALLRVARLVVSDDVEIVLFHDVAAIPAFNPDTDPAPESVEELRSLVKSSDGLLIATPEYAFGLPGSLKNLLDWLVGSGELYEKRVAILSAAPSRERGQNARADLDRTLRAQGAFVLQSTTIAVPANVRGYEADEPEIREAVLNLVAVFQDDA